jgi:hypothetical protein
MFCTLIAESRQRNSGSCRQSICTQSASLRTATYLDSTSMRMMCPHSQASTPTPHRHILSPSSSRDHLPVTLVVPFCHSQVMVRSPLHLRLRRKKLPTVPKRSFETCSSTWATKQTASQVPTTSEGSSRCLIRKLKPLPSRHPLPDFKPQ